MADREEPCQACEGTGKIIIPSIQSKVAFHLMTHPDMGLQLVPDEVKELGAALGLVPKEPDGSG